MKIELVKRIISMNDRVNERDTNINKKKSHESKIKKKIKNK